MSTMTSRSLRDLARLRGIQLRYRGNDGSRVVADDEVLFAVLRALGEPVENGQDVEGALENAREQGSLRVMEPVIAHRQGRRSVATALLPADADCTKVQVTLRLEDGSESQALLSDPSVGLSVSEVPDAGARAYTFCAAEAGTPLGYHTLVVEGPGFEAQSLLISAPRLCPRPARSWGAFIPLYALRREKGDWGVGSFGDLCDLGDWIREQGGDFVATLPVLAHFLDGSGTYSGPYLPASKLAWNEAYVELGSLAELGSNDRWAASARARIASRSDEVGSLQIPGHSDMEAVLRQKRPILELLARSLFESANARRKEFEKFVARRPELHEYARFRAASETFGRNWQDWPGAAAGVIPDSSAGEDAVRYHLYSQWVAHEQLVECQNRGLYLDMPIGVHPSGFDTWWEPSSFVSGVSGGAPPDRFFSEGQSWGFRPLHPAGIRSNGYRYVISCLRHVMAHATMVRIDHVMGMNRLYWVPDGLDARRGAYVSYRADEMHALLVLEASRSGTVVVGEDLGTVPAAVRSDMARDGVLSSFVMQFASSEADPFPEPPERSIATLGTHDLPTFRAYWSGYDIEEQHRQGRVDAGQEMDEGSARARWRKATLEHLSSGDGSGADPAETALPALRGLLEHLGRSPADVVLVDLEDLWLEPDQQNRPGTGPEEGNFTRRASRTMEEFEVDPGILDVLGALTARRSRVARESMPAK